MHDGGLESECREEEGMRAFLVSAHEFHRAEACNYFEEQATDSGLRRDVRRFGRVEEEGK